MRLFAIFLLACLFSCFLAIQAQPIVTFSSNPITNYGALTIYFLDPPPPGCSAALAPAGASVFDCWSQHLYVDTVGFCFWGNPLNIPEFYICAVAWPQGLTCIAPPNTDGPTFLNNTLLLQE